MCMIFENLIWWWWFHSAFEASLICFIMAQKSVMCHIIKDKLCTHTVHRMVTVCFLNGICLSLLIKFRKLVRFSGLSSFKLLKRVIKLGAKKKKAKKRFPVCILSLALVLFLKKKLGFLFLFADNNWMGCLFPSF